MKYTILSFCALMFYVGCFAQLTDTINWRANYKLKWEDFKGEPDSNSLHGAVSYCTITYKHSYEKNKFNYKVYCFFVRDLSWAKINMSNLLLTHELGHFNISEVFARKLRQAFKNYKYNPATVDSDLQYIYQKIITDKISYNNIYDNETSSSTNIQQQMLWNNKIINELDKLKAFKN